MSVLVVDVVEFEVSIPCLEQARESAERFDQVGGQFWAVGRREIKMGDFTEARNPKPKEPKENQLKRLLTMICVSEVDSVSFHPVPCCLARLCNDASSVGPLTMAGTIFLQIVALVVSFFMAVQYFLRYAPRRLFGLFPPWCLVAMKLDENRHAAMRRRLDY